ncbi:uncharacterized protein LOC127253351 [Andrographis paniculata]|uniref:uncharacterized protein LOC127253351 n=1 Tax=Andrographis paniculata TaxID=175694 RepID=UPI0021E879FF|nr:uncharacterized protein LOC127253351 [Andrographis paniculata]
MEEPQLQARPWPPQIFSPRRTGRRTTTADSNSPEFEFWMVRNPISPQPNLLSADELFSGGVLLPLHLLRLSNTPPPPHEDAAAVPDRFSDLEPEPNSTVELPEVEVSGDVPNSINSKRWRRIFKKNAKKSSDSLACGGAVAGEDRRSKDGKVKEKRREKKNINGVAGASNMAASAAELNINIWPFSRSRSAGNGGTRPRTVAPPRKVSSAPCSRSNSSGESKSRKWAANSPSRAAGVHLGRSSPVWQVRRGGGGRSSEAAVKNSSRKDAVDGRRKNSPAASKAKALSLNVPMCIGYRQNLRCRSEEQSAISATAAASALGDGGGGVAGEGVRRSNLFNIRSLFTRKSLLIN